MNSLYQLKVDVGMLNTVKNDLADASIVSPSSEQKRGYGGESIYSVRTG